jgi:hypothetical protein
VVDSEASRVQAAIQALRSTGAILPAKTKDIRMLLCELKIGMRMSADVDDDEKGKY